MFTELVLLQKKYQFSLQEAAVSPREKKCLSWLRSLSVVAYCCILLALFAQVLKLLPPFWLLKYVSDFTTLYWILLDHYFHFHTIFKGTNYTQMTAIMRY